MKDQKNYESTVMRMAGNIATRLVEDGARIDPKEAPDVFARFVESVAKRSVCFARAIVAEVHRTEPKPE